MAVTVWSGIVRGIIGRGLKAGLSANRIWNRLPEWGLPKYHRETFLNVVREIRGVVAKPAVTEPFDRDIPFPRNLMVEGEFPYITRYKVWGSMTLYDPETDRMITTDVSFYSDENLGVVGWEREFKRRFTRGYGEEDLDLIDIAITTVVHQKGDVY